MYSIAGQGGNPAPPGPTCQASRDSITFIKFSVKSLETDAADDFAIVFDIFDADLIPSRD